jgi:cytochrome c-type biogenesis protein CcmH
MRRTLTTFSVIILLGGVQALAAQALGDLEDQVRAVAAELRCPVCQNLSVADSPSELAREMRGLIREQLTAGKRPEEIKAYFVSRYGEWILLAPKATGLNLLVWILPFVGAVSGGISVWVVARRWVRRGRSRPAPAADPAEVARLREDLARSRDEPAAEPRVLDDGGEPVRELLAEKRALYAALRELEIDHQAGNLSAEDFATMRLDYEARAIDVLRQLDAARQETVGGALPAAPEAPVPVSAPARQSRRLRRLVLAGFFLILFGGALGAGLRMAVRPRLSEQDTITGDFLTGTGPGGMTPGSPRASQDLQSLLASGRLAYERQEWQAAITAFKAVLDRNPDNPEALSYMAVLAAGASPQHADLALGLVDRALRARPGHPLALWTKGTILFDVKKDYAGAIAAWEQLLAGGLAAPDAIRLGEMIAEARSKLGSASAAVPPSTRTAGPTISGTISVAPGASAAVPPGGALFIIARQGSGPPLAVKRIPQPQFPLAYVLGPDDVMRPGGTLSGEVTLIARLKRSGAAGPAEAGDLEGAYADGPVLVGKTGVDIMLLPVR